MGRLKGVPVLADELINLPNAFKKEGDGTDDDEHKGVDGPAERTDLGPEGFLTGHKKKIFQYVSG